MITVLGIIFFILAFLLMGLILLQEGKGGGLAAMGGAMTDSVMGARNPLRRLTAYFFIAFVVLSLGINWMISRDSKPKIGTGLKMPTVEAAPEANEAKTPDAPEKATDAAVADKAVEEPANKSETEKKTEEADKATAPEGEEKPAADADKAE